MTRRHVLRRTEASVAILALLGLALAACSPESPQGFAHHEHAHTEAMDGATDPAGMHAAAHGESQVSADAEGDVWYCPMHAHVTSDHEGSCPICGMKLVRKVAESPKSSHAGKAHVAAQWASQSRADAQTGVWYCPMHAHVTSDHEGSCPICGMKLVRKGAETPKSSQAEQAHVVAHGASQASADAESDVWYCPMHAHVTSDHEGWCPICGMKLVRKVAESPKSSHAGKAHVAAHGASQASADAEGDVWYCPMHAHVTSDHEGSCPICGMKLVRKGAETPESSHEGEIHVPAAVQRRMGVVTEPAQIESFQSSIPVSAQVVADQRRTIALAPRVEGWIERLGVSVVGQRVHAGQMIYEIYSPELQQRQKDYLDLLTRRDALVAAKGGDMSSIKNTQPDLMLASVARERFRMRSRLLAAGVPPAVLEEIEKFRRVRDVVPVLAPQDGLVTAIRAQVGRFVGPGEPVITYSDPDAVWAELSLSADLLPQLADIDHVLIHSPGAQTVRASIDPSLAVADSRSRRVTLPVPLPNTGTRFLPGMLLDAEVVTKAREALTVPVAAVLRSGQGDIVVVAGPEDHFRPAFVQLGRESADRVEVLAGLAPGETVVTNGQFLLSAESSLQSLWRRTAAAR